MARTIIDITYNGMKTTGDQFMCHRQEESSQLYHIKPAVTFPNFKRANEIVSRLNNDRHSKVLIG